MALLAARAQDEPEPAYTITVYGDGALRQARWDLIMALKREGWEPLERGGRTVFKPPRPWMGRAVLHEDGTLSFRYPVLAFQRVEAVESAPPAEPAGPAFAHEPGGMVFLDAEGRRVHTLPAGRAAFWLLPSRKLLDAVYAAVRRAVKPQLEALRRVRRDTEVRERLDALPDRLDALWERGLPLDGGPVLESREERIEALLRWWGTLPDDFEGEQLTRATEAWMRHVLLVEHRPTPEQIARAEAMRADGRRFPRP